MMTSLQELYRIGIGPSASHTMGPRRAAEIFRARTPGARAYRVTLYGSLAATGKGHLTDQAIRDAFAPEAIEIRWRPEAVLPLHPNGMEFESRDADGAVLCTWRVYSTGGGALREEGQQTREAAVYALTTMAEIISWTEGMGDGLWAYAAECEGAGIWEYLAEVWRVMQAACLRGITTPGVLPGSLRLTRKGPSYYAKARWSTKDMQRTGLLAAYAFGVAEENAAGGVVATAPTCGSCGVLPAVLMYLRQEYQCSDEEILRALATAGLVGNLVKTNASLSGAEVGCQGEIGTACAMAAAAAAQLMGGSPRQIEYAAEMGIEHHLGLTCDPVAGLVQIPCIERNAIAALRAMDCAIMALFSDGTHRISFDQVVKTMWQTGRDLPDGYRETSSCGLAVTYSRDN